MTRDEILKRAAKLAALASQNASLAEAEVAAALLGKLLAEHRLSIAEVTEAAFKDSITEETVTNDRAGRRRPRWVGALVGTVATACSCRSLLSFSRDKNGQLHPAQLFIGDPAEAAVAAYFFEILERLLPDLAQRNRETIEIHHDHEVGKLNRDNPGYRHQKLPWSALEKAFICGAIDRIGERLTEMLKPTTATEASSFNALMAMKGTAIDAWIKKKHPKVRQGRAYRVNRSAMALGYAKGDDVSLARGVGTSGSKHLIR